MAKQSGIHQLNGKVRGMSYYRTAGVSDGLVRTINEGMSSRVKNGEEYSNTRRNNSEFTLAANTAGAVQGLLPTRWRYMLRRFAQAEIAKELLSMIKQNVGTWGERDFTAAQRDLVLASANNRAKYPFDNVVNNVIITDDPGSPINVQLIQSDVVAQALSSLGVDDVEIVIIPAVLELGMYNPVIGRYTKSKSYIGTTVSTDEDLGFDVDVNVPRANFPIVSQPVGTALNCVVVAIFPRRTMAQSATGSEHYVLQEYCSFKVYPIAN